MRGRVLLPGDDGYEEACVIFNGMHRREPAVIVQCSGAADVIDCVNFARKNSLLVAVKGGGHNSAGNALCDGGLVIDLSRMNGVHVDPQARTARCGGGATWSDVDREGQAFGLAVPGGIVSTTGIAGLTLGGGVGWLRRKYGLTVDSLISVDIVTADGQLRRASATEETDLFWGVRGGGGNFGVVTSFEFQMHPVGPMVYAALTMYLIQEARVILRKWRDFMQSAPDEVTSNALMLTVQPYPMFPEEVWGERVVFIATVYSGTVEGGERVLAPFGHFGEPIFDHSGPIPFRMLQSGLDAYYTKGKDRHYWKSLDLASDSDEVIDAVAELGAAAPGKSLVDNWAMGGAVPRVGADETAYGDRSAPVLLVFNTAWEDAADDEKNVRWTRESWESMKRYSSGSLYLNFPGQYEEGEQLMKDAFGANYARLVEVKNKYDPTNLFRLNQNIPPA